LSNKKKLLDRLSPINLKIPYTKLFDPEQRLQQVIQKLYIYFNFQNIICLTTPYVVSNVKKYLEQHNGNISVQSVSGSGTKNIIGLPVIKK
jgi:hypothetical protein